MRRARVRVLLVAGNFRKPKGEVIVRLKKIIRLFSAACVLGLLTMAVVATPVSAAAEITLNPDAVLPGGTVSISGRGFIQTGDVSIVYEWGGVKIAPLLFDGTFSTTFEVPPTQPHGSWEITVTDNGGNTAKGYLEVASFTLNPNVKSGYVGDVITLSGGGHTANQQITVLWDGNALRTLTASSTGTVSGTFTVPESYGGNHTISISGGGISHVFTVNPKITLGSSTGAVGDTIVVNGTGFPATSASSAVGVFVNSMAQIVRNYPSNTTPTTTNSRGSFSVSFMMPLLTSGDYTVRATVGSSSATETLTVVPKITLGSNKGAIGDTVSMSGRGFSSGQSITFTIDGTPLAVSPDPVVAFSTGEFSSASFIVPSIGGGVHEIAAVDENGYETVVLFTVTPSIDDVSASIGAVGKTITVRGKGFVANSQVTIAWDDGTQTTVNATSAGIINTTISVPTIAGGIHIITFSDSSGNFAEEFFDVIPSVTIDKPGASGGYGDIIPITFKGFTVGKDISSVEIMLNGVSYEVGLYQTVKVGANGIVSAMFRVPAICGGTGMVYATDNSTQAEGAPFTVTPKLTLQNSSGNTLTSGCAGDIVVVLATGFGVYRDFSFTCNGISVAMNPSNLETNENGSVQFYFALPEMEAGLIKLIAKDGVAVGDFGVNIAEADFIVEAKIVPEFNTSPSNPGYVGLSMKINGTGFKGSDTVAIFFDGKQIGSISTSSNGSFSATIKIPAAAAGQRVIRVTDGLIAQEADFFMDSTPPGVATLKSPEENTRPRQPVVFSWNAVTDPSGVTYILQISQDPNFGTLIFQKTGISTNSFKMGNTDILAKTGADEPYYWRVMAVDLADNQGDWSVASSFTIGSSGWPVWATIVLICFGSIIAIALLIFLGLWLGHRLAYRSY